MNQHEKRIQTEILLAITKLNGAMFWREQSAKAWVGRVVKHEGGLVTLSHAMPIVAGVPGIADIMGTMNGRAVGLEVKTKTGVQEDTQRKFERAFTANGGAYSVVRSADEALQFLRETCGGK